MMRSHRRPRSRPRRLASAQCWLASALREVYRLDEEQADKIAHAVFIWLRDDQSSCGVGDCGARCACFALVADDPIEWCLYSVCAAHSERINDNALVGTLKFHAEDRGDVVMLQGWI
jgi:hypothetical protein